jgi:AI-2 transport protein TqsA
LVQHGFGACAIVLGGYVAINLTVGNVIEPHLMGKRLGLSTLVVFLSLVFWGWLWGVAGMLLSVPLTMIVKIAMANDDSWRWLAVLMDQSPRAKPGPTSIPPPNLRRGGAADASPDEPEAPAGDAG